ncbi:MAG: YihY/virulence factor BrkB family protein [Oscillospiraceae bacterium]|nr:YihY/virulence factor BrkB family protein [Oscillospiraceae bacterium]
MKKTNLFSSAVKRYTEHELPRTAASLTYYLVFMLFPFLLILCVSLSHTDVIEILSHGLASMVPAQVLELITSYVRYVEESGTSHLLGGGIVLMMWSIYRAVATIVTAMNKAWGIQPGENLFRSFMRTVILTLFITLCIFLVIALVALNTNLLRILTDHSSSAGVLIRIWGYLRYPLLASIVYVILSVLFRHGPERALSLRQVMPGVLFSLLSWFLLSVLFAWYAANIANYTNIYGSLSTIIVLLLWLNLGSLSIILGSEINALIDERRSCRRESTDESGSFQ